MEKFDNELGEFLNQVHSERYNVINLFKVRPSESYTRMTQTYRRNQKVKSKA